MVSGAEVVAFLDNDAVLKKLRVAFELEDDDIIALLQKNGLTVSKNELGNFLKGLASVN
ncbi:MAG TPA: DUF1456 family protein [Polyangia bacterium]|nr:DUF1456 family protein [Polyangia bacterium]